MIVFDNHIFNLNEDMVISTIQTPLCKMTIIDSFYKDFNGVNKEIEKLPVSYTCANNEDMVDMRGTYASTMKGTELPYMNQYSSIIKSIIGYAGSVHIEPAIIVNFNKTLSDRHLKENYNVHTDPKDLSTVVFLNNEYEDGDGLNTYYNSDKFHGNWSEKSLDKLNYFIQAKPNRAVLFAADLLHGACIASKLFESNYRKTQVIFAKLN